MTFSNFLSHLKSITAIFAIWFTSKDWSAKLIQPTIIDGVAYEDVVMVRRVGTRIERRQPTQEEREEALAMWAIR